ncbi:hypothetical protein ACVDFE_39720 [Lentzea chajnantorensis]
MLEQVFHVGDKVVTRFDNGQWIPARVIRDRYREDISVHERVRVTLCLPELTSVNNGLRFLPVGTPTFWDFHPRDVRLVDRDPGWSPHATPPFSTPPEYEVLGGSRPSPLANLPGLTQLGAYTPSTHYESDDPVWVWETTWKPATVISASERWIRIRYRNNFRDKRGNVVRAYRPPRVWPVLCEHSAPTREFRIDAEWLPPTDRRPFFLGSLAPGQAHTERTDD